MHPESADRQITVLAVDDEELILDLLVEFLAELGYSAVSAENGVRALAFLTAGREVDLLITDVRMPGMSGIEVARKARELHPDLPILFVSGYAPEFYGTNLNLDAATAMLTKPFTLDRLAKAIDKVLH